MTGWAPLFHPGEPLSPHDLWGEWSLEPTVLIPLTVLTLLYIWGVLRAWQSAGRGRGITTRSAFRFGGAVVALLAALVSPLDALAGSLFSAHMAQHMVLMLAAAPLLVASDLPLALLWALPRSGAGVVGRRYNRLAGVKALGRALENPALAWMVFTVVLWAWHLPGLYETALRDETIHAVEHAAFLASAMLFWWVLVRPGGGRQVRYGVAVPYLFTTGLQSGILGALMTFTTLPWYPYYNELVRPWGLTPLQDQQIAGIIMWLPGSGVFTLLTIAYFAAWLKGFEQRKGGSSARIPRH